MFFVCSVSGTDTIIVNETTSMSLDFNSRLMLVAGTVPVSIDRSCEVEATPIGGSGNQCVGSGSFFPDPDPDRRIQTRPDPDPDLKKNA